MIRIFRVFIPTTVVILMLSEIILLFACLSLGYQFAIAQSSSEGSLELFLFQENGILRIGLAVATMVIGLYFQDLYTDFRLGTRIAFFQQLMMVVGLTFLGQALLTYANRELM